MKAPNVPARRKLCGGFARGEGLWLTNEGNLEYRRSNHGAVVTIQSKLAAEALLHRRADVRAVRAEYHLGNREYQPIELILLALDSTMVGAIVTTEIEDEIADEILTKLTNLSVLFVCETMFVPAWWVQHPQQENLSALQTALDPRHPCLVRYLGQPGSQRLGLTWTKREFAAEELEVVGLRSWLSQL